MAFNLRGLIDQFRKPVAAKDAARMSEEVYPAGSAHSRPPFEGHIAWGIDPQKLGGIMRAAETGSSKQWFLLAEEIEEHFPHYGALLGKRKRQVALLPITVVAADEKDPAAVKHAEMVRDWLATGVLQAAMFDIADALGKGFSNHEIVWEQEPGKWTRPAALRYLPQRFHEFSYVDGETVRIWDDGQLTDLAPYKTLVHRHKSKSGNTVRSGLTWSVAMLWCYATFTQKDWQVFINAYGMPLALGLYGPDSSDGDRRVLKRAVAGMMSATAAILPKSMAIEFPTVHDKTAGTHLYLERLKYLDQSVSKLVLGGTAGTEAINGGHAVGQEHRQAEDDVEKFDAGLLAASINRAIVKPMVAFTFGPQDAYPRLVIGRPDEIPIKDIVTAIADLGPLGFTAKASEIRDRLQLTKPEAGDELVGGRAPDAVDKPTIPSPTRSMPADGFTAAPGTWLAGLFTAHPSLPEETVANLTQRLGEEAAGALHGLTEEVRTAFMTARGLDDLKDRLHGLKLDRADYGEAMARGLALAHLVGQAELLEEIGRQR
jgi:phage gp29-like protein